MNLEEIKQAVTNLAPDDLARFRMWFKDHQDHANAGQWKDPEQIRETVRRLRGSLKGKGVLKAFMEERRKESLL